MILILNNNALCRWGDLPLIVQVGLAIVILIVGFILIVVMSDVVSDCSKAIKKKHWYGGKIIDDRGHLIGRGPEKWHIKAREI